MEKAIKITGLTKYYGPVRSIEDLSLEVPEGRVFGFIGPNGAGKTTTIRTMLGLIHASAGSVSLLGTPVTPGGGVLSSSR